MLAPIGSGQPGKDRLHHLAGAHLSTVGGNQQSADYPLSSVLAPITSTPSRLAIVPVPFCNVRRFHFSEGGANASAGVSERSHGQGTPDLRAALFLMMAARESFDVRRT